jgi:uncharacterized protein (DUF433 family)
MKMAIEAEELIQTIQQLPQSEKEYVIESILNSMQVKAEIPHVISDRALLGGEPVIWGTKTPVRAIVELWRIGIPPEEIPEHLPHITLAQVFGALSYYAEHQAEINHYIEINRIPEHLIHPAVQPENAAA